jgi:hypothetical protein
MKPQLLLALTFAFWLDPALQSPPAMEPAAATAPLPSPLKAAPKWRLCRYLVIPKVDQDDSPLQHWLGNHNSNYYLMLPCKGEPK